MIRLILKKGEVPREIGVFGLAEDSRPACPDLHGGLTFWSMLQVVSTCLKKKKWPSAAQEFLQLAEECDGDTGMLFTIALHFVTIPEE